MPSPATDNSHREIEMSGPAGSRGARVSPLATLVVGLAIGLLAGYLGHPWLVPRLATLLAAGPASPTVPAASTPARMEDVIAKTRNFKGEASAPVTIVEFGDFQ
jgi:hypothetical protein